MKNADERKADMRALVVRAHAEQRRNGGRVPYAAHVLSVAEILADALAMSHELDDDAALAVDLYLAALGHDLYEDTPVTPEDVRAGFGARVDALIEGMTNRGSDQDRAAYVARMGTADEGIRLIKVADLIDNVLSCAYGIHDLGRRWVADTFQPIADEMAHVVSSVEYVRFRATANLLLGWLELALRRLQANLTISRALDERSPQALTDAAARGSIVPGSQRSGEPEGDALRRTREREWREGALLKGGHVFPLPPVESLPGRGPKGGE